jgi:PAS domain S-box-containing protein
VHTHTPEAAAPVALLESIIESVPVGCAVVDRELRLTRTNAALAALTGRSSWELLGAQVTDVFAGLAPDTPSLCRRVMDTRTPIVGMFAAVGGRALRIDYHPLPAANGGSSEGLWIVVSDATVHHALNASEARYQSVVAAMAEGVILVDAEARITACNASAERILGRDHDEIIGRALGDSLCAAVRADGTPEPADELPAVDTLRTGRAHHDVVRGVRAPDGRMVWISLNSQPLLAAGETRPHGVALSFTDVTERQTAERLATSEMRLLEMVATESPLTAILRRLALLVEDHCPGAVCAIMRVSDDGESLHPLAAPSLPVEYLAAIDGVGIGARAGSCGTAVHRREPVYAVDIATDPLWTELAELALAQGLRACWSAPVLAADGSVPATIAIYFAEPRAPSTPDIRVTDLAVSIARLAIERERAREALRESERKRVDVLARMLRAEDEERARIAADLHDDTIQVLTGSLLSIDRVLRAARTNGTGVPTALTDARVLLASTLDRTRRLMFEIRPPLLESHGLGHAVGELLDQTRRDMGVQVAVTIDVARLSPSIESLVYRTVQELVANARKHAHATRLEVSLKAANGRLQGLVGDDGSGFDTTRARDRSVMRLHLGLQAVAERLRLAGGDFSIESRPGVGTTARFGLPLQ